jgi:hypothetical protein
MEKRNVEMKKGDIDSNAFLVATKPLPQIMATISKEISANKLFLFNLFAPL